jgi:hypothetical protein
LWVVNALFAYGYEKINYKEILNMKYPLSQLHFGLSVRMKLTLPKVGTWSPLGLSKIQSSSSRVKKFCIDLFFIPLERSLSVDVQNGLA